MQTLAIILDTVFHVINGLAAGYGLAHFMRGILPPTNDLHLWATKSLAIGGGIIFGFNLGHAMLIAAFFSGTHPN